MRQDAAWKRDWGNLPNGGKDGLFLIVVSLGWWILLDPPENSIIDDAIADVAWVIDNLVSLLSAEATNLDSNSDSDSTPNPRVARSPAPQKKRSKPVKIGPPSKRTRRARS